MTKQKQQTSMGNTLLHILSKVFFTLIDLKQAALEQ